MPFSAPIGRRLRASAFLLALSIAPGVPAHPAAAASDCAPPRTRIALVPLADRSDRVWSTWSGVSPARWVAEALADSLVHRSQRDVLPVPLAPGDTTRVLERAADDAPALAAARRAHAEVVLTGSVVDFVREDRRDPARLARWGVGALDARSRARVTVVLRLLDARDGSVIIESVASRERTGRATANVQRDAGPGGERDALLAQALGEVLGDLTRTLSARLDARWNARVLAEYAGTVMLDAGRARGLFAGARLDVVRGGVVTYDEDFMRLSDDQRVGAVIVVALEGDGRARARLLEGEVRAGDRVRPCSLNNGEAVSLRR